MCAQRSYIVYIFYLCVSRVLDPDPKFSRGRIRIIKIYKSLAIKLFSIYVYDPRHNKLRIARHFLSITIERIRLFLWGQIQARVSWGSDPNPTFSLESDPDRGFNDPDPKLVMCVYLLLTTREGIDGWKIVYSRVADPDIFVRSWSGFPKGSNTDQVLVFDLWDQLKSMALRVDGILQHVAHLKRKSVLFLNNLTYDSAVDVNTLGRSNQLFHCKQAHRMLSYYLI